MATKKKKDKKQKPTPSMLGSGMAKKAGGLFKNRGRSIDSQVDAMVNGTRKRKDEKEKKGRR